jgi:UDP-N-acetylmuramoyl-tripeptide--D-alanyl-D-alanine ligase
MMGYRGRRQVLPDTWWAAIAGLSASFALGLMVSSAAQAALSRADLDRSLELGTGYLLRNQTEAGDFVYLYDLVAKKPVEMGSQVRQAGSLWGLSLIHLDRPTPEIRHTIENGLEFFQTHSRTNESGARYVVYPGDRTGRTGTTALVGLAWIDFLRSSGNGAEIGEASREAHSKALNEYLSFLLSLRDAAGQFAAAYSYANGERIGGPSPYFDGEILLALVKAAKYIPGHEDLRERILESAASMHRVHVEEALAQDPDSAQTKGFFQWGILSYYELFTSGWEGTQSYAQKAIDLAHWMIDVHRTLDRTKNTAYAMEGIAAAYELARLTGDAAAQTKFKSVLDQALTKLISWQAGHPLQNDFLESLTGFGAGLGGVMNSKNDRNIRVDVVQHQMHAVLLARRFVFNE